MKLWRITVRPALAGAALAMAMAASGPAIAQQAPATTSEPPPPASISPSTEPAPASTEPASTEPAAPAPGQKIGATPPRPILPPADPTAAAAYAVLDKHCARCHQGTRLERTTPAAGFGNILRLDEVAAAPFLVQRGNPDASRLYLMMLRRLMPFDVHEEQAPLPAPTPDEISAVRTWIASLSPHPVCRDRRFVTPADHARALAAEPDATANRVRYVSIAHLHNGCVGFEALKAYRQAIVKLINSLSWKPVLVPIPAVDKAGTLFRINLDDLGWLPEHWERIMRSGADPLGLMPPLPADVRRPFGTAIPVARADWFAETVMQAPLYYEVLGLPGTGPEILKVLQVDRDQLQRSGGIARGAVKPSRFSILPSLVERIGARTGGLWTGYHAIARDGASDPSSFADRAIGEAVPHHASRTMFTLPNGFPAFYIVGQRGDRLDALPPDIVQRSLAGRGGLRAGLDCMGCHGGGPVVHGSAGPTPRLAEANASDRLAVAEAHRRLQLEPGLTLDGVEPVQALALEYSRPLAALRAASELGIEPQELVALADRNDNPGAILARRLVQGLVTRAEIEARGRELSLALGRTLPETDLPAPAATTKPVAAISAEGDIATMDAGPGLILYSDKARYKQGDLLQVVVRVASDCHLTLVSVDQRGRGTVIYPSDFETSTLLTAGQEVRLPGASAPYSFRLSERGREQIVALCNEAGAGTDGILHDFERQRFTDLGNYAAFLAQNAGATNNANGAERAQPKSQPRQRGGRRGRPETAEQKARPEQITRTAITIVVE